MRHAPNFSITTGNFLDVAVVKEDLVNGNDFTDGAAAIFVDGNGMIGAFEADGRESNIGLQMFFTLLGDGLPRKEEQLAVKLVVELFI